MRAQSRLAKSSASIGPAEWLALAWLVGALTIAIRLLVGVLGLRRAAARAQRITSSDWLTLLRDVSRGLNVRRRVPLLAANGPTVPITWGIRAQ